MSAVGEQLVRERLGAVLVPFFIVEHDKRRSPGTSVHRDHRARR